MTITGHPLCARCRAVLVEGARFCAACGEPTARLVAEKRLAARLSQRRAQLAMISVAVGFAGTLAALVAHGFLFADRSEYDASVFLVGLMLQIGVGVLAAWPLGIGTALDVLRPLGRARDYLECLPAASLAFLASLLWVGLVRSVTGAEGRAPAFGLWLLLDVVVVAPLIEEWLCRGVLWRSTREVASRNMTLVLTSILFALLHFLNGGSFLELPHRFVAGLLFGCLRIRSGSLWPCVLAHLLLNLVAVLLA